MPLHCAAVYFCTLHCHHHYYTPLPIYFRSCLLLLCRFLFLFCWRRMEHMLHWEVGSSFALFIITTHFCSSAIFTCCVVAVLYTCHTFSVLPTTPVRSSPFLHTTTCMHVQFGNVPHTILGLCRSAATHIFYTYLYFPFTTTPAILIHYTCSTFCAPLFYYHFTSFHLPVLCHSVLPPPPPHHCPPHLHHHTLSL